MKPRGSRAVEQLSTRQEAPTRFERSKAKELTITNNNVLFLQESHFTFEPPNQKVSVFFDECNREIIRVTNGVPTDSTASPQNSLTSPTTLASGSHTPTKTRVVFQATDRSDKVEFLLPIEKRILSIKFNSNRTILAYHVEKSNVEFINVSRRKKEGAECSLENTYVLDDKRYIHPSRSKNSKLFGFLWTGVKELVMITDISIEYYHVDPSKRRLKHMKSFQSATNWFVYQPCHALSRPQMEIADTANLIDDNNQLSIHDSSNSPYSILMVSTGSLGNSMQPYMFCKGQTHRLQKFEVDRNWKGAERLELFERSITIASIYGQVRLLVLQHENLNLKSRGAQILLYTVDVLSGETTLSHTLDLDVNGRFAINILDNLIVAHDQPTKTSFIFDIMIESTEKSDCPKHHVSLINKQTIRPLRSSFADKEVELYSTNWVFFQPNFIIDAKVGLLLTLHLNLNHVKDCIQDSLVLLNFLALRKHSEQIILDECRRIVAKSHQQAVDMNPRVIGSPLNDVSSAFDILGHLVVSAPDLCSKKTGGEQKAQQTSALRQPPPQQHTEDIKCGSSGVYSARLAQEDISREVLSQLNKQNFEHPAQFHFISSTLLEFIFACRRHDKNVDFCVYEQLVNYLLGAKRYYQIVQMIKANILKDSKQLACLLLTKRDLYLPATQLGLDMLQRLNCLTDLVGSLNQAPNEATSSRNTSQQADTASGLSLELHQSLEVTD